MVGLEPTIDGIRIRCLTNLATPHPRKILRKATKARRTTSVWVADDGPGRNRESARPPGRESRKIRPAHVCGCPDGRDRYKARVLAEVQRLAPPRSLAALEELVSKGVPAVFPHESVHGELIEAGRSQPSQLLDILRQRVGDRKLSVAEIPSEAEGLMTHTGRGGLAAAWTPVESTLAEVVERMLDQPLASNRVLIHGAPIDELLPELAPLMHLPIRPEIAGRLWLGNARGTDLTFDAFESLRWVFVGKMRVYLFPPSLEPSMQIGALEGSHLGTPISLLDPEVDDSRLPQGGQVIDLHPGEILFVPTYWWHCFRSEGAFGLINHSWTDLAGRAAKAAHATFWQSVLSMRELPTAHRDHYARLMESIVFRGHGDPFAHLPEADQGLAGTPTAERRIELRRRSLHEAARMAREALRDDTD